MKTDEFVELEQGVFIISLDFELIWGTLDLFGPEGFQRACEIEREEVIERLLDLFVEFGVSATWCILGHLFLERCHADNNQKHPDIVRPTHSWHQHDWFERDPCGSEASHPIFYGKSLVAKILACPVPQEIGCHSFSHVVFGDPGCSRATAESEVSACVRLAQEMGVEMRSFAFPRNSVGHLDVLRASGFTRYRGPEPHEQSYPKSARQRWSNLWDVLAVRQPPVFLPEPTDSGLWNIAGSMMYYPMHGYRRMIPLSWRVQRAVKGLNAAAREKRILHLWFHPTNMADHMELMFSGLRRILEYARALQDRGELAILPMGAPSLTPSPGLTHSLQPPVVT